MRFREKNMNFFHERIMKTVQRWWKCTNRKIEVHIFKNKK